MGTGQTDPVPVVVTGVCPCSHFIAELGGQVVPPYMIATKEAVKEGVEPVWTRRKNVPNVTESYHNYMTNVS